MAARKTHSPKGAERGRVGRGLERVALLVAGYAQVACSNGNGNAARPGDGGAHDATVDGGDAGDAALDAGATEAGSDATDDASDAMDLDAAASCPAVDAGPLDDAEVALGQQIVSAHKCPSCHGETLSGNFNGVPSPTLEGGTAYPPNLTSDPATGLGCWTNAEIENAFLNGIDNQGTPLCPPMPRFGHIDGGFGPTEAHAVVQYLRSLPIFSQDVPSTPDCPPPDVDAEAEAATDATADAGAADSPSGQEGSPGDGAPREGGD
jgi:hypothetical protein